MAAPLKTIRFGPVSLAIWENNNGKFTTKSCQIIKNYYDEKSGSWKTTNNFKVSELVNVVQCCQDALDELYRRDGSKQEHETNDDPIPF